MPSCLPFWTGFLKHSLYFGLTSCYHTYLDTLINSPIIQGSFLTNYMERTPITRYHFEGVILGCGYIFCNDWIPADTRKDDLARFFQETLLNAMLKIFYLERFENDQVTIFSDHL